MKNIKRVKSEFQKVVFDKVLETLPGGVIINSQGAKEKYPNGIIPAGTAVCLKDSNHSVTSSQEFQNAEIIGLTLEAVPIDDIPMVAVVTNGTARIEALPQTEKENISILKTKLPKITFY